MIDQDERRVAYAGRPLSLTAMEFALLAHLARRPERVYTKRELLREV